MLAQRRVATMLLAAVVSIGAVCLPGKVQAGIDEAAANLLVRVLAVRAIFPNLRDRSDWGSGTLELGETRWYRERFEAGVTYVILAVGCGSARDIDIGVKDLNGNLIALDTSRDTNADVRFVPQYTGSYLVGVQMAGTTGEVAHFAYQVFYLVREH